VTTQHKLAYLFAERQRLNEQRLAFRREFDALRQAGFPRIAWDAYRRRRQEYLGLVANHVIALQWTLHPPCGRLRCAAVVAKRVA